MTQTFAVDTTKICPRCPDSKSFECLECDSDLLTDCDCIYDREIDEIHVLCHNCQNQFDIWVDDVFSDPTRDADLLEETMVDSDEFWTIGDGEKLTLAKDKSKSEKKERPFKIVKKCRHLNHEVKFPDKTSVFASSAYDREITEESPDFGLYLDGIWSPSCLSYLVDWTDYGIPRRPFVAAQAIMDSYNKAREGFWVEVGCIGGHGRTGTALACMAILAGVKPNNAVRWVRANYCKDAIEGKEQEWFIKEWFAKFVHGGQTTPEPLWDYKEKEWYDGPTYKFDGEFYWKEFDPMAFKSDRRPSPDEINQISIIEHKIYLSEPKKESSDLSDQLIAANKAALTALDEDWVPFE